MPRTPVLPAETTPLSASRGRDSAAIGQQASAEHSGPAAITATRRSADGLLQLQIRRELLAAEAKAMRNRRQCRAASICEAQLARITHEIMKMEMRDHA